MKIEQGIVSLEHDERSVIGLSCPTNAPVEDFDVTEIYDMLELRHCILRTFNTSTNEATDDQRAAALKHEARIIRDNRIANRICNNLVGYKFGLD